MQLLRPPGASRLPISTLWQLCKPWATERGRCQPCGTCQGLCCVGGNGVA